MTDVSLPDGVISPRCQFRDENFLTKTDDPDPDPDADSDTDADPGTD